MSDPTIRSFFLVLIGEMGDKTQLLAIFLAAHFKRPWMVMWGILCATLLNHSLAAALGGHVAQLFPQVFLKWILIVTFCAFAVWVLFPDKDEGLGKSQKYGVFVTTLIAFFLAEMGDKTQLVTVALGAQYQDTLPVTVGTTLGMLVADGGAIWAGQHFLKRVPFIWLRIGASVLFVLSAIAIYFQKTN